MASQASIDRYERKAKRNAKSPGIGTPGTKRVKFAPLSPNAEIKDLLVPPVLPSKTFSTPARSSVNHLPTSPLLSPLQLEPQSEPLDPELSFNAIGSDLDQTAPLAEPLNETDSEPEV